ncbi:hypothetical protein BLS_001595 [Venturia inaequalis]|uniref:Uncharacterized protein n=1 Tax=Venturia inaequalis TaxID=5025 RepID=A0A8H3YKG5_VENIN|nr:hypothetical protein BLS_001595 [Venturia inaequalis]
MILLILTIASFALTGTANPTLRARAVSAVYCQFQCFTNEVYEVSRLQETGELIDYIAGCQISNQFCQIRCADEQEPSCRALGTGNGKVDWRFECVKTAPTQPIVPPAAEPIVPPATQPILPPASQPILPPATQPILPPATQPILPPDTQPEPKPKTKPPTKGCATCTGAPITKPGNLTCLKNKSKCNPLRAPGCCSLSTVRPEQSG